ncbi:FtsK/SpoIIIE domain-containing protein [Mycolicibacterium wolinskyi]|uniref:FtsK/SpoIIIE domain-containing protein n=1 Tax=Mycolicibacterium wolinskyi TaxID=59750 RepID=UPI00104272F4|nr:FtsK/SpoIIIE domain-containing protein [Mycolicibacterium wolinskyi]
MTQTEPQRRPSSLDPTFGVVRFGIGNTDLSRRFEGLPTLGRPSDYEPTTYQAISGFLGTQRKVRGIAKPVALRSTPGLALVGENGQMDAVYALVRSIVLQAAMFHSPSDLKVMVITDNVSRWESWLKWLPHCQHATLLDTGGSQRLVWTSVAGFNAAMGEELHNQREKFAKDSTMMPHWLVINDLKSIDQGEWQTVTRADGVAGVTFVRLAAERGEGLEFRATYVVSPELIRYGDSRFAVPDQMSERTARTIARRMARWRPDATVRTTVEETAKTLGLGELLGVEDFARLDTQRLWSPTRSGPRFEDSPWGDQWLRFPIGRDDFGNVVAIDMKEDSDGGDGTALVLVGTTGSGKSEFWTTLILSACLTHSPEMLNIMFFDFKGATTAQAVEHLPHVVAAQNNLRDDSLWMERMCDVLYGELEIRKSLLSRARVGNAAEYEYRRIHKGEPLTPMPTLLLIIDEFTQMFIECPQALEVCDEIGRQGRALGVRLLMGSQRLGHEMDRGIMVNIPIRSALRTLDAADSRKVIGVDEAKYLPKKPGGAGYLQVPGKDLIKYQTAYVSGTYHRPRRVMATEEVRTKSGYVPPREFLLTGMEPVAAPAPASAARQVRGDEPDVIIGPDGRELRDVQVATNSLREQTAGMPPQRPRWLPPLAPLPVDELVNRLRGKPWHVDYGQNADLLFPVGIEDRPFQHAQRVYALNLLNDNCGVFGVGGSGKTVAIATMLTGAALMYTPQRVQFFVLAFSGSDINVVESLPQVSSFARASDRERVLRTIGEMEALIDDRERAFGELGIGLREWRERKFGGKPGLVPNDPYGDVFLVLDGWATFREQFEDNALVTPLTRIVSIMNKGRAYGVHVVLSATGWINGKLLSGMSTLLAANVELKLDQEADQLNHNKLEVAKQVPFGEVDRKRDPDELDDPAATAAFTGGGELGEASESLKVKIVGRGTSMAGYHFQTALPQLTIEGQTVEVNDAATTLTRYMGPAGRAAKLRLLPTHVTLDAVFEQATRNGQLAGRLVPFGISEVGLRPALVDFTRGSHLLIAGDPECGSTTALRTLARALMRVFPAEEIEIFVVDPQNKLAGVVEGPHLGTYADLPTTRKPDYLSIPTDFGAATQAPAAPEPVGPLEQHDGYVYRDEQVRAMAAYLGAELEKRKPSEKMTQAQIAAGIEWKGRQTFVIVDREEMVQAWGGGTFSPVGHPLQPLVPYLPIAREVGLHLIVGRRVTDWVRANGSPVISELLKMKAPGVVMSGDKGEGEILGGVKASKMPVGRGIYVGDRFTAPVQIATSEAGSGEL